MVDSEDITLENIKTQELSLDIITLSKNFNQNATVTDNSSESSQVHPVDHINKSKSQFKKFTALFAKKYSIGFNLL